MAMTMRFQILVVVFTEALLVFGQIADDAAFWKFPSCTLECQNGGTCSFVQGTADDLSTIAQEGRLIEKCECQEGYTGLSCQFPCRVAEKSDKDNEEHSNSTNTKWKCDDSSFVPESLSDMIGKTEYCSEEAVNIHRLPQFCTNGGRCKGDFLEDQVDVGSTTMYRDIQFQGCDCPRSFHGPHCEFLRIGTVVDDMDNGSDYEGNTRGSSHTTPKRAVNPSDQTSSLAFFALFSLALLSAAVVVHFKDTSVGEVDFRKQDHSFLQAETQEIVTPIKKIPHFEHYIYNVVFDEGIILPETIHETSSEDSEFI